MEPDNIMGVFFSLSNPVVYVIIFFVVMTAVVVMIKRDFITPLKKRIQELEKENDRLLGKVKKV